ncbi:MAG: ABC transporter ATP-binding protein [Clostridia bacterium]
MKKQNSIIRLYADNKKYLFGQIIIIALALLSGVLKTQASVLWGNAVDFGIAGEVTAMLVSAGLMAGIYLLDGGRTALLYKIIGHVSEGMFCDVREKAFAKLSTVDTATLEEKMRSGDTATRLNGDIESLSDEIGAGFSDYVRLVGQGIIALIACLFLSWQLSVIYVILLPISVNLVKKISMPIQNQTKKSRDSTGTAMNFASDAVTGVLTVKAFKLEKTMADKFQNSAQNACDETIKTEKINMKLTAIKYIVAVIQLMVVFIVGAYLITNNILSVGSFLSFTLLSGYINEAFSRLDAIFVLIRKSTATADRIYEIIDLADERNGSITKGSNDILVNTKDLVFAYGDNIVLNGIDIKLAKGQKIAFVGPSGCGKSTMIKLIAKFYNANSGDIDYLGENANDWDYMAWRKNLSIVSQDSVLFDGTIFENISYGKSDLTKEEAIEVLKSVKLWDFVSTLPNGLDYQISEFGAKLSGGQKQRLCIARAMVKNADLILLDEATSALDVESEKEVQTALNKLTHNKSAVIVAHRLTTVQNVDYIYYLEHGKVKEEGSPQQLLAIKGEYFKMCQSQGLVGGVA